MARESPREQRRARRAEVQEAGRRRRDAGAHARPGAPRRERAVRSQRARPRSRSASMSSTSSRPTATRIIPWAMPAACRCSSLSRPCEVLAGCVIVVLVSPRLAVIDRMRVASMTWKAFLRAAAAPLSRAATMNDDHRPAATRLLRHRQRVLRVRLETRVIDALHARLRLEPAREHERALALRLHADRQASRGPSARPRH